jgi:hypothetical protein
LGCLCLELGWLWSSHFIGQQTRIYLDSTNIGYQKNVRIVSSIYNYRVLDGWAAKAESN